MLLLYVNSKIKDSMNLNIPSEIATDALNLGLNKDDLVHIIKMYIKQLTRMDEHRKNSISSSDSSDSSESDDDEEHVKEEPVKIITLEDEKEKMIKNMRNIIKEETK